MITVGLCIWFLTMGHWATCYAAKHWPLWFKWYVFHSGGYDPRYKEWRKMAGHRARMHEILSKSDPEPPKPYGGRY